MVYKFVLDQLSSDEKIECEYQIPNGVLYATNKRIIKFDHIVWWSGLKFQDLDYKHIISIKFEEKRNYWLLLVASFLVLIVVFLSVSPYANVTEPLEVFLFVSAILFVIFALIKMNYWENKELQTVVNLRVSLKNIIPSTLVLFCLFCIFATLLFFIG